MPYQLYDLSRLSINSETNRDNDYAICLKTSYFKDINNLRKKIKEIRTSNKLICLEIDCLKNKIFGIEPHLAIYKACDLYQKNPKEALDITYERAFKIAHTFLNEGIDLYTSEIFSFSERIFKSINANQNFLDNHTAIMSNWINGLNCAGMLSCAKIGEISNKTAQNTFYRLRVQISAVICSQKYYSVLKNNFDFKGYHLDPFIEKEPNSAEVETAKITLGGRIRQESHESIEV